MSSRAEVATPPEIESRHYLRRSVVKALAEGPALEPRARGRAMP